MTGTLTVTGIEEAASDATPLEVVIERLSECGSRSLDAVRQGGPERTVGFHRRSGFQFADQDLGRPRAQALAAQLGTRMARMARGFGAGLPARS